MKRFASYGSLRKGFYNHDRFGLGEPIATSTIRGAMYVNPYLGYPMLYENGDENRMRDHVVEIYEVEDDLFDRIDYMERCAGYEAKEAAFNLDTEVDADPLVATVWFMHPIRPPLLAHWVEAYKQTESNKD